MEMNISVAICTWNRANLLDQTLCQMHKLQIPKDISWELLVVNNNCSDATDTIISLHANSLPLRRIFEHKTGLSNARNAAVEAANGDYILWTDDDVLVDEKWVEAYVCAFKRFPEAAVFGGPIFPWFEGVPPAWLIENLHLISNAFALRDIGDREMQLDPQKGVVPFGANYAIRMSEQSKFKYDPNLGLKGQMRLLGEEAAVINKMLATGSLGLWVPEAKVRHFIPRERQTLKYIRQYYVGHGRTQLVRHPHDISASIHGRPKWLLRKVIETHLIYCMQRILFGPSASIKALVDASFYFGLLK